MDLGARPELPLRLALAIAIARSRSSAPKEDRNRPGNAKKRLQDEISLLRDEIDRLRSSSLESLVPKVLCKCFTDPSAAPPSRRPKDPLSASGLDQASIARLLDSIRFLNGSAKKRRHLLEGDGQGQDRALCLVEMANLIVELVSNTNVQLLSVWLHQAVDFFESCVAGIVGGGGGGDPAAAAAAADGSTKELIARLVGKVVDFKAKDGDASAKLLDYRPFVEKVLLHLAEVPSIGHRILVDVTGQIAIIVERLGQATDPFAEGTTQLLENSYFLLELLSKVLEGPFLGWLDRSMLDAEMLEEFVGEFFRIKASLLRTHQVNFLLVSYTDRLCSQVVKQLHTVSASSKCTDPRLQRIIASALERVLGLASSFQNVKRLN